MKPQLLLFSLIFFCEFGYTQKIPKFELTKDGFAPVVIQFDTSFSAEFIYGKIKEWILLNNKNPKSVTRIDNENSLLKFSCYEHDAWRSKINDAELWNSLQFTFSIEIKNAKCRVTFEAEENRYKFWYNDDGTIKDKFRESESDFENTVNTKLKSIYDYIVAKDQQKTDDW